jgi:hypothetical protein
LKWHVRFHREGKPPTLGERGVGVIQTLVAHVMPLLMAYFAAGLMFFGFQLHAREPVGDWPASLLIWAYSACVLVFLSTWGLTAWFAYTRFRAMTYVAAFATGATLAGCLAGVVGPDSLLVPGFSAVIYYLTCLALGGSLGAAMAWFWQLPRP